MAYVNIVSHEISNYNDPKITIDDVYYELTTNKPEDWTALINEPDRNKRRKYEIEAEIYASHDPDVGHHTGAYRGPGTGTDVYLSGDEEGPSIADSKLLPPSPYQEATLLTNENLLAQGYRFDLNGRLVDKDGRRLELYRTDKNGKPLPPRTYYDKTNDKTFTIDDHLHHYTASKGYDKYFTPWTALKGLYETGKDAYLNYEDGNDAFATLHEDLNTTGLSIILSTPAGLLITDSNAIIEGEGIEEHQNELYYELEDKGLLDTLTGEAGDLPKNIAVVVPEVIPPVEDFKWIGLEVVAGILGLAYIAHKIL